MHSNTLPEVTPAQWSEFFLHQAKTIEVMDDVNAIRISLCSSFHSFHRTHTIDRLKKEMQWCTNYASLWDRKKFHREKKKKSIPSILNGRVSHRSVFSISDVFDCQFIIIVGTE